MESYKNRAKSRAIILFKSNPQWDQKFSKTFFLPLVHITRSNCFSLKPPKSKRNDQTACKLTHYFSSVLLPKAFIKIQPLSVLLNRTLNKSYLTLKQTWENSNSVCISTWREKNVFYLLTSSNFSAIIEKALKIASVGPVIVTILSGQEPSEILIRAPLCQKEQIFFKFILPREQRKQD